MIRATVGTWGNYATTLLFQIVFATRYGGSASASVFVVAFGVLLAFGSVVTSSVQSLVVPRLVLADNRLSADALRLVRAFGAAGLALLALIYVYPSALASLIAAVTTLPAAGLTHAFRAGALFMALQTTAGALMAIAIARGARFPPAIAPALPSLAGTAYLLFEAHPSVPATLYALATGAAIEALLMAFAAFGGATVASVSSPKVGALSIWTAVQFVALTMVAPLERIVASIHGPAGAADYNYAIRSLAIAEQLLVGGLVLASLGDWSRLWRMGDESAFNHAVWRAAGLAMMVLVLAGSMGAVASHWLVALVYEHGRFTSADTALVARLLVLAIPGFCAEGISLVLAQALLASRRNRTAVAIGFCNFGVRVVALFVFGVPYGARGVAVAYSVGTILVLVPLVVAVLRLAPPSPLWRGVLARQIAVASSTVLAAVVVATAIHIDAVGRVAALALAFGLLVGALKKSMGTIGGGSV